MTDSVLKKLALLGQEGLPGSSLTKIENADEEVRKNILIFPCTYARSCNIMFTAITCCISGKQNKQKTKIGKMEKGGEKWRLQV